MSDEQPAKSVVEVVGLSGSLPSHCGLAEPVGVDAERDQYFLLTDPNDDDARIRGRHRFEQLIDQDKITLLSESVEAPISSLAVHLTDDYRQFLGDEVVDQIFTNVGVETETEDGKEVVLGQRDELKEALYDLAVLAKNQIDEWLINVHLQQSEETLEQLVEWSNLGISAAQHHRDERFAQLTRHGHILALMGEGARLLHLHQYSVSRPYSISLEEFQEYVRAFAFTLSQRADRRAAVQNRDRYRESLRQRMMANRRPTPEASMRRERPSVRQDESGEEIVINQQT